MECQNWGENDEVGTFFDEIRVDAFFDDNRNAGSWGNLERELYGLERVRGGLCADKRTMSWIRGGFRGLALRDF